MNFNKAAKSFLSDHCYSLAENTRDNYRRSLNVHLIPVLALKELAAITHNDLKTLHISLGHTPQAANYAIAVAKKLFNHHKVVPNPAIGIRLYNTRSRETYLTPPQLEQLFVALRADHDKHFSACILLLVLTGARKREILGAEWKQVNFASKQLLIPKSKTGKKYIVLSSAAIKVLDDIYDPRSRYIIPSYHAPSQTVLHDKPRVAINKKWERLRLRLGIPHVRIHDLRHTFASLVANLGTANIFTLRDLLHHANVTTTQRYAHLFDKTLRDASDQTGSALIALGLGISLSKPLTDDQRH